MKSSREFMNDFIKNIKDMKQYQGIDICNPASYSFNRDVVHNAYKIEKNIVSTQESCNEIHYIEKNDELDR